MHVNKVHHLTTITRIANDLGEDEDWLRDVANDMEFEDGVIWVYGVGEDGVQAFPEFGIENLIEFVSPCYGVLQGPAPHSTVGPDH